MALPLKLRLKVFTKLAQAVPGAPGSPASPASPTSPTSPNAPTQPTSTQAGTKNPSQPASSMMNLPVGWTNWAHQLDRVIAKVDRVIIAGTKSKYNFNDLFQNKFPSGADTEFAPPDPTGDVIRFARQIYQSVMNSGTPFREALKNDYMRNAIWGLLQSPYLQKFQQVNQKGPLANVGADISTMKSDLLSLFNSIPAQ